MTRPVLLLLVAVVVTVLGDVVWWKRTTAQQATRLADTQKAVDKLFVEMAVLRRQLQLATLRRPPPATDEVSGADVTRPAPSHATSVDAHEAAGQAEPAATGSPPRTNEEIAAELDERFDAEDADPGWSPGATARARDALSAHLPEGTVVNDVECRRTMCRVDSIHDSFDAFNAYVNDSLFNHGAQLWDAATSSMVIEQDSAGVRAVTYIAREGESIPEPD